MDEKIPDDKKLSKVYKEIAPYAGLGLQLAITVGVMVFLGVWLDGKFETTPVLTVIGSFLGITIGMYSFIKTVLNSRK